MKPVSMMDTPGALIILGFTGDLTKRKLLPSLYRLEEGDRLPKDMKIYGVVRRETDLAAVFTELEDFITEKNGECNHVVLQMLRARVHLIEADVSTIEGAEQLKVQLDEHIGPVCRLKLFYFAVPPTALVGSIHNLAASGVHMCGGSPDSRLLIEKPFGRDVATATDLAETVRKYFGEDSIYLIDHYLAKDTVQNMLHVRFHNPMLQSLWTAKDIQCIQINALESLDIQGRGKFYEQTGALRDMLQSHLMQLLAIVTMDEPDEFDAVSIRKNKMEVLSKVKLAGAVSESAARAQYEGYKDEADSPDSNVETFAAVTLRIDNDRWRDVPVYLRSGKAMQDKRTQVDIVFKSDTDDVDHVDNVFTFRLQPQEGIAMRLIIKKPGLDLHTMPASLDYCFNGDEDGSKLSGGYDKILLDAIQGDQTLFPSDDEIMNNWRLYQPVLDEWEAGDSGLSAYEKGSADVDVSAALLAKNGHKWVDHSDWL